MWCKRILFSIGYNPADRLQKLTKRIVDLDQCITAHDDHGSGSSVDREKNICAGGEEGS